MTDKQIIIDGVDVSGCEKQGETIAGITCGNGERIRLANEIITKHKLCKDNPNCVYKQLKRKEQECKELRTHCKHIDETNKILYNEKVQLLDKNQELQDKLLKLNDLAHEVLLYELQTLDIDFDEYETHVRDTEFSPIVTRCTEMIDLIGYSDKCNKEV